MERKKIIFFSLSWLILSSTVALHAAEKDRFAYLDAQKVLDGTKAGQRAKNTMQEYRDSRQKIIDLEEGEIKRLQDDLERQEAVLSAEARRERQENLQKKLAKYQKTVADMSRELDVKKRDILEEFNRVLVDTVKRIAEKEGFTFVFDLNAEGGVLLYAKESYDITDRVIKELDATTE